MLLECTAALYTYMRDYTIDRKDLRLKVLEFSDGQKKGREERKLFCVGCFSRQPIFFKKKIEDGMVLGLNCWHVLKYGAVHK